MGTNFHFLSVLSTEADGGHMGGVLRHMWVHVGGGAGACPGGAQGAWPPPLEIEKQKKKKKRSSEQIISCFTYILLLF